MGVTGAASARQKQVEVGGSSYHGEKNMPEWIVCQSGRQLRKPGETQSSEQQGRRSETIENCMKLNQIRQLGHEADCEMMQRPDIIHEKT